MLDRTQPPPFNKISKFIVPDPERHLSENQIPVYYYPSHQQPVIKIEIAFKGGKWIETKKGAAYFTLKTLREGTKSYDVTSISKIFDYNGASLNLTPGFDHAIISCLCLTKKLENLIPVINEILSWPLFPEEQLEKLKKIRIEQLRIENKKNSLVASKNFRAFLFGENHAYGSYLTEDDVNNITTDDLHEYFDSLKKIGCFILISGDVTNEVLKLADNIASNLKPPIQLASQEVIHKIEEVQPKTIEMENSIQASLRIGKRMILKTHPDFKALLLLNELFGGYFGSRLMQTIRERKGLTYGIHSQIVTLKEASYFVIGTDVNKEKVEEAISGIYSEMKKLIDEQVDEEELETVKNYFVGSMQAEINTPFDLADKFKSSHWFGLTNQYYSELFETINETTPKELQDLAKKYFEPETMLQLTVG